MVGTELPTPRRRQFLSDLSRRHYPSHRRSQKGARAHPPPVVGKLQRKIKNSLGDQAIFEDLQRGAPLSFFPGYASAP